ncbi:unnamed protein product [Didymodactylos carnosus]|uniref:Uncharacterized protein n=1 Tax=Didymodactylos carnosus TaxID=1234261 RepID=A0A8S2ECZ9_9BILA|nr:unnamed protein product [Didymodactylos carnosus]CAF4002000.1 unnamed protein product [Didymodactylos carnosus]
MHLEAGKHMMVGREDNPHFPQYFTYIRYDKEKINQTLDLKDYSKKNILTDKWGVGVLTQEILAVTSANP